MVTAVFIGVGTVRAPLSLPKYARAQTNETGFGIDFDKDQRDSMQFFHRDSGTSVKFRVLKIVCLMF